MAQRRGETITELFLSLGLDISQLESDFIAADRNVNEAMARLRRQSQLINLRAQVELEGLDEAADGARRLEVREQALNEQLTVQRDRIRLTEAALQQLQRTRNQDRAAIQRAQIALERERLTMAQLENQLQSLREEQEEMSSETEELPDKVERATTAITAGFAVVTGAVVGAAAAIDGLIEKFDEMQLKAYELHASFEDTRRYLRQLKFAGAESDDLMGFIRGIDDALIKGDVDDPETMALKKYGVNLFDDHGRLKEYTEQLELLYEGYRRAKESGEEVEYVLMLNGESIHEILPLFERWEEAKADAAKIEDAGLNFTEMHEASREMALLKDQTEQFVDALTSAAIPGVRSVMRTLFDVMRDGTAAVKENEETFRAWGITASTAVVGLKDVVYELESVKAPFTDRGLLSDLAVNTIRQMTHQNPLSDEYGEWLEYFLRDKKELQESNIEQYTEGLEEAEIATRELEEQTSKLGDTLSYAWRDSIKRAKDFRDELEDLRIEIDYADNDYEKSRAELEQWLERETRGLHTFTEEKQRETEELLSRDDLPEETRFELTELLANKMKMTAEEQQAIEELYAAKSEQIEQERADRIEEIREREATRYRTALENQIAEAEKARDEMISVGMEEAEAEELYQRRISQAREEAAKKTYNYLRDAEDIEYEMSHTAFEKKLYDIDRWKEAQMARADTAEEVAAIIRDAAAKETEAFEREVDRIKGLTQSLEDEIYEMENSQYEVDKRRALQKAQKALDEGVAVSTVQRYLQDKFAILEEKAAQSRESGSDYAKSPNSQPQYIYEFGEKPMKEMIGLFADEEKIRVRLNEQLAGSTREVIDAQKLLVDQTKQGIDIIEGDRVVTPGYGVRQQDKMPDVRWQSPQNARDADAVLRELPTQIGRLIEAMESGNVYREAQGAVIANAGYIGDLYNYKRSMETLGIPGSEAFAYLERATQQLTNVASEITNEAASRAQTQASITVSPDINIDLGGAYVFDDAMKQKLTNDIVNQVADGIKQAVEQGISGQNYGYAS